MTFIAINDLAAAAKKAGLTARIYNNGSYLEVLEQGTPDGHLWQGCVYSAAQFVISDDPKNYFYNPFFHGPRHPGLARLDQGSVQRLLSRIAA
jgi:hypothetical protein